MSIQERLDIASELLSTGKRASEHPRLRELAASETMFMILCELPGGIPYCAIRTRRELRIDHIPAGIFHRPDRAINFHVLVAGYRNYAWLMNKGWL